MVWRHRGVLGGGIQQPSSDELDVTVKIWDAEGKIHLTHGILKDEGAPIYAYSLDHEADCVYDYGRSEIHIEILGYGGSIERIAAWFHTVDSPCTVLDTRIIRGKVAEKSGFVLSVTGIPLEEVL